MKKIISRLLSLATLLFLSFSIAPMASAATAEPTDDIVGIALGNEDFSILVSALQKAELVDDLQGGRSIYSVCTY